MSLLVVGSVAFDDLTTPFGRREHALGGSATYFSLSASRFHPVRIVAVVGDDFGPEQLRVFDHRPIDLKGLSKLVTSVSFSPDGTRIVMGGLEGTAKVWDAKIGNEMPLSPGEIEYRLFHTQPNFYRYLEGLTSAMANKDPFAKEYFIERLLSMRNLRTTVGFQSRIDLVGNPLTTARTSFHQQAFAKIPYDQNSVEALALAGDRLAQRLVAQERIREGKPALAVPLLTQCMITRPRNAPPVEELLIAKAYLALNDRQQAERFYRAATEWLDRPRNPIRAAEVTTKSAINGWAALGEAFKPIDDPRHNTFDWESWHESDVFRAEVEAGLAKK